MERSKPQRTRQKPSGLDKSGIGSLSDQVSVKVAAEKMSIKLSAEDLEKLKELADTAYSESGS